MQFMSDVDESLPDFRGEQPVNYQHFRESVALALHCEGVDTETIQTAIRTVDDAVVNNETSLVWESDLSDREEVADD